MNENNTPLVINVDTGVISFRTEENAAQCNCRPISYRHAMMVESGELELKPLLAAIKKHMMSADDFDYEDYAAKRKLLNVRHTALHADDRVKVEDAKKEDYISDEEIAESAEETGDAVDAAVNEVSEDRRGKTSGSTKKPSGKNSAKSKETPAEKDEVSAGADGASADIGDIIK